MLSVRFSAVFAVPMFVSLSTISALAVDSPRVLDPQWKIEPVATEPNLVTPVGCCFDDQGRLLVVECHTHFPPDDYTGPKTDRIYRFDDSDGDGVLDRQIVFYEGGVATMGIAKLTDGWFAVATRSEVSRIRDSDDDGIADEREVLLTLKTVANYPHNGLAGLAIGPDSRLYVGQGENFGENYELIANDGTKQVGGGEGGNVFSCTLDGRDLNRIATGFWNPFGLYFDSSGRLWTVGNDPDAMPPCRLLHVVTGGDYGFQFRFGRAGTHPLLSWNGEFPGTLPMAAGTGEAPCAVLGHRGSFWVSSWGDNRVERYELSSQGASWKSQTDVIVQGDANFRPVGMAEAPDGSVYITDWVDRSYPVHGKGRLWRMSRIADPDRDASAADAAEIPGPSAREAQSLRLANDHAVKISERLAAMSSDDPWIRQAAATGTIASGQLESIDRAAATSALQRVTLLTAWRWQELCNPSAVSAERRSDWIAWGLSDSSEEVLLAAIRWATERGDQQHLDTIRDLLSRPEVSPRLFAAVMGSVAYLETGSAARGTRDPAIEKLLSEFVVDASRSPKVRTMAIQMLPPDMKEPSDAKLREMIAGSTDRPLAIQVVRLLSARESESARRELAAIALEESIDLQTRADAAASLARNAGEHSALLNRLVLPRQHEVLRSEARRILKRSWDEESAARPDRNDVAGWDRLVGAGTGGNVDSGRRVFFRTTCVNCHAHSGRGAKTGPDLTTLSGTMTSQRVLESLLNPSKEVGPLYVPWRVLTTDGRVLTGLKLDRSGVGNSLRFQGADGDVFEVPLADIETQDPMAQSIMPTGLEETMSLDELRDLIAFLVNDRQ